MISVLIVDDDGSKVADLSALIKSVLGETPFEVVTARTANEGGQCLRDRTFDLAIVDLQIPMRNGAEPRPDGGIKMLSSARGPAFKMPHHVIGLTAHDNLLTEHSSFFRDSMWHLVKYARDNQSWSDAVTEKLRQITNAKQASDSFVYDIAILTALHKIELEAVLKLPANWRKYTANSDDSIYHVGSFERDGRKLSVVAAASFEMGMPAAAAMSMKIIHRFRPRYLAMTGIAAGIKGSFGDVLIADRAWDYGSGKSRHTSEGSSFFPAPSQIPLDAALKEKFAHFATDDSVLKRIRANWLDEPQPTSRLSVLIGPIASGAAVVESKPLIDQILLHNRKAIGVEMEAYGVFLSGILASSPRPLAMVVKSICDFATPEKNDEYQRYAAYTSATYLYEFALAHL